MAKNLTWLGWTNPLRVTIQILLVLLDQVMSSTNSLMLVCLGQVSTKNTMLVRLGRVMSSTSSLIWLKVSTNLLMFHMVHKKWLIRHTSLSLYPISSLVHLSCLVVMAKYHSRTFKLSFRELFKHLFSSKDNSYSSKGNLR